MHAKTALVAGTARGIGLATTRLFIEQGWRVAKVDQNAEELENVAAKIGETCAFVHDVSIPEQVTTMKAAVSIYSDVSMR